jgi:hypothetical protein
MALRESDGPLAGYGVTHEKYGHGRILIDMSDRETHTMGEMRVEFNRTRRWVRARNLTIAKAS